MTTEEIKNGERRATASLVGDRPCTHTNAPPLTTWTLTGKPDASALELGELDPSAVTYDAPGAYYWQLGGAVGLAKVRTAVWPAEVTDDPRLAFRVRLPQDSSVVVNDGWRARNFRPVAERRGVLRGMAREMSDAGAESLATATATTWLCPEALGCSCCSASAYGLA